MNDWTSGYVADVGYTYGYYQELNPARSQLLFLNAGIVPPDSGVHCELGFGQGLSVNVHAAASASTWYGTDFNPAQCAYAQSLAKACGSGAHLYDQSFEEFCARDDLPEFDSIGLHGIWSWISDENRHIIVEFIRRKLKVGGVVYISYNTQPGWAAFAPVRHLMTEHADTLGAKGAGTVKRVEGALEFVEKLFASQPLYAKANPSVIPRLAEIQKHNTSYLAHEYFNRDWEPMHFAAVARWLEAAKIDFACSANYLDNIDVINLTASHQEFLKQIPDATLRQSVRDFMVNQQFRKDCWVKGPRRLDSLKRIEALRAHRVMLVTPREDIQLKIVNDVMSTELHEKVYGPILDALKDHQPKTLAEIEISVKGKGVSIENIVEASVLLTGMGHLETVQESSLILKSKVLTDKLNRHIIDAARSSNQVSFLASPVIGAGVGVERFHQLFLLAIAQGKKQPMQWVQFVWEILAGQKQLIVKDGKPLQSADENIEELTKQVNIFATRRLPILKALQIA